MMKSGGRPIAAARRRALSQQPVLGEGVALPVAHDEVIEQPQIHQ